MEDRPCFERPLNGRVRASGAVAMCFPPRGDTHSRKGARREFGTFSCEGGDILVLGLCVPIVGKCDHRYRTTAHYSRNSLESSGKLRPFSLRLLGRVGGCGAARAWPDASRGLATTYAKASTSNLQCMAERAYESLGQKRSVLLRTAQRSVSEPLRQSAPEEDGRKARSIAIIGGGVSGIWSALTLKDLGYTNVTIIEREMKVGGKAAAFSSPESTTHSAR